MNVYRLIPKNFESINWEASIYQGIALVRAASEVRAREIACLAFVLATEKPPLGQRLPTNPWRVPSDVDCEIATDTDYPQDGPEELIEPEGADSVMTDEGI